MLFRRRKQSEEEPQVKTRGFSITQKITGVGLAGLVGAVALLVIATVSILDIRSEIFARDEVYAAKESASNISYYSADIAGWQLGVLADVSLVGPEEGLDGPEAFNQQGFEESAAAMQKTFD